MTTLGATVYTLADYKSGLDPDGGVAAIVEALDEVNELTSDVIWKEGNLLTGHRHTIRSGIPTPTWRRLNYGVAQTKSRKVQVEDTCGMLEAVSAVDERIMMLGDNKAAVRWSEDKPHIEGMGQELAGAFIYSNEKTDPEQITGLTPRYNDSSAESGNNMINGGGTGSDNTSIWLVGWGDNKVFGIHPKGTPMGLRHRNQGLVEESDSSNRTYMAYKSRFYWDCGLAVADWRYAVRICNIDVSDLATDNGTPSVGLNIIKAMIKAMHKIPNLKACRPVFYCNSTVLTYLDLQTLGQSNMNVTYREGPHGEPVYRFRGIQIKQVDQILNTESAVTFS